MDWSDLEYSITSEIHDLADRYVWTDVLLQGDYHIQKNVKNGLYRLLDVKRKTLHRGDYQSCKNKLDGFSAKFKHDHLVLMIHGLGRHAGIMKKSTDALRQAGLSAHSLNYATLFESVDQHADHFTHLLNNLQGIEKVSFVTHSLGGLVARELLCRSLVWNGATAHKIVMMGVPINGAEIAEFLSRLKAYKVISGPSGQDVLPTEKIKDLPEPAIPALIIAGGRGNENGYNPLLSGDNDGIVTVKETRLEKDHQFLLINSIHTKMMDHEEAILETIKFLSL